MQEILLELEKISYSYERGLYALSDISMQIGRGERIALIGENGSGKSTLFLILNGVLRADRGEIRYRGKRIGKKDLNILRKHIGLIFQDADQQMIAPTVYEEVSFGPMNMGIEKEEVRERTQKAIEEMNLSPLSERLVHSLSGGEKRRVSIADITAMEPEIMLFDEPASGLDRANQHALEQVLNRLSLEGKTLMVSTHDMDFAYRFAEKILVFSKGRLIAKKEREALFADEALLAAGGIEKPLIKEISDILKREHILGEDEFPRTIKELKNSLEKRKEV